MRRISLLLLLSISGCLAAEDDEPARGPGLPVAPAMVVSDTALAVSTGPPDPVLAAIDSLRVELRQLRAAVSDSQAVSTGVGAGPGVPEAAEVRWLGIRIVLAILVLALAYLAMRLLVWILENLAERSAKRRLLFKKIIPISRLLIWSGTIYYVVRVIFNVDEAGLLAAGAALGVGLGFAAQGVLKNLIGGLIIIFDQPFQVGDKISVGGTYGEVVSIGMRSTRIVTPDDNLVSVPNAQVVEGQVANANSGNLDCQVVVSLWLPGWIDVRRAKEIAHSAAVSSPYVYLEKPVVVHVKDDFRETFLTRIEVKAYVIDTRHEFALASDITENAKAEFIREGMLRPEWSPRLVPAHGARDVDDGF